MRGHDGVCFWVDVAPGLMASAGQDCLVRVYRDASVLVNGSSTKTAADVKAEEDGVVGKHEGPETNGDMMEGVEMENDVRIKEEDGDEDVHIEGT